ncbi:MAG: flagellar hook-associated protein FlgK [Nitrospiraceae bacterium]|nr:flagellar hook-associated protein FlgK [Nitrospiraceae bacterium]
MGGLNNILNIAQSALFASQSALNTTSNNIANVNTPGYADEKAILEPVDHIDLSGSNQGADSPGGVAVTSVQRQFDSFLQAQIYQRQQSMSSSDASSNTLGQLEQVFNETGQTGLATSFNTFVNDWQQVASNPTASAGRNTLLSDSQALVSAAQDKQGAIEDAIKQANDTIKGTVDTVNSLASSIAQLNGQIVAAQGTASGSLAQLMDQRDNLMQQLSQSINFSYYTDNTGQVSILAGMGQNLVSGAKTNALSAQQDTNGDYQMYLNGTNITSNITGGTLGGLISARSDAETQGLLPLNRFMAGLTQQVNNIQKQGFGLDGSTGNPFFSPLTLATSSNSSASITASVTNESQLTLDQYNIKIDTSNNYNVYDNQTGKLVTSGAYTSGGAINFDGIQTVITGSASSGDTFTVDPLKNAVNNMQVAITNGDQIAASSSASGLPGDNSNALAMVNALNNAQVSSLGGQTVMDYYQGIVSTTGSLSKAASDNQTFESNLLDQLNQQRDSVSGVSIDEESVNLIKYQQAYEAAAKVVQTTSELFQTLMNL